MCTSVILFKYYLYRSGLSEDPCLRNALAGLYSTLYGRLTPPCISQVLQFICYLHEFIVCLLSKGWNCN